MENASKALIIAGAILLSILIIGLGMFIYDQASGAAKGINMDAQKVTGTQAKALFNLIKNHNNSKGEDASMKVYLTIDGNDYAEGSTYDASSLETQNPLIPSNTLKAGNSYNVTFATDPNSGLITACNIKKK